MPVNHVRLGAGTPLVLIHGIGHRWQAWHPVLDRLAAHHEVIAIDLPGFGASPVPAGGMPTAMPAVVGAVVEFFASTGLAQPHVAGYSLGGAISLELAAAGAVASATAFSPAGFYTDRERRRALRILRALRATSYLPMALTRASLRGDRSRALCYAPLVARPERVTLEQALGDAVALRHARGFETVARAARDYRFTGHPTVPVTIGWGAQDRIFQAHQLDRARQVLPEARHEILTGCGHVPMGDDPALVARLILQTTGVMAG